jgi:hypothetical protein
MCFAQEFAMFLFTTPAAATTAETTAPHAAALQRAASSTGVSFGYLVETARRESGFRANAQASTSSARGLYQFIADTWLRTFRSEGGKIGLGAEASQISLDSEGRAQVASPATKARLLALRDDPAIAARLAAALARDNSAQLTQKLGRAPSDGEIYIAHFLGPVAAAKLIALKEQAPDTNAASVFSSAASANRAVFYTREGAPRSAATVYAQLVKGFSSEPTTGTGTERAFAARREAQPFFSMFQNTAAMPETTRAAALWANPSTPGQPLDLNAFRVRSWWA